MLVRVWLVLATIAAALPVIATPAAATVRISEDRGGQIGHYLRTFALVRSTGERVVIDGNCLSACTLVLGLVPRDRVCATARARFGFHAAWMPDAMGRPVTSEPGTQALWDIYPTRVRGWISRNGGLSRRMIFLQGRDLSGIVPSCGGPVRTAETTGSVRGGLAQAFREERASASRRSR